MANEFRIESDSLGERELPVEAYYGIQTQRAKENFPISGLRLPEAMIRAIATIKIAAARVNCQLGELDDERAEAIIRAASEVRDGLFDDQFIVDVYQAGAGTSFHMNANEVIANRANELLAARKGDYTRVNPNDHVNMGQSTNDVFPTAMRLAALDLMPDLLEAFDQLAAALDEKAKAFAGVIKSGRTHLQDAVPITLGQEFSGYAQAVFQARRRLARTEEALLELGIGGSAAGTGLNTLPEYRARVVQQIAQLTELPVIPAGNLFEAMQSLAPFADTSAAMRNAALELIRIANDFRLLSSGPRTGFDELRLPAVQPGSSIMPGKINPSMAEMLNQVCFQVLGNDTTIAFATQAGQLELNVMMPVVAYNLLSAMRLLTNALVAFTVRCVRGLEANTESAHQHAMRSLGLATALNPLIGYRAAAEVVKQAIREGRAIPDVVIERKLMSPEEARRAFSPETLTRPGRLERRHAEFVASEPSGCEWVKDPELLKDCETRPDEWDLPP